jgi:hypothetical protein
MGFSTPIFLFSWKWFSAIGRYPRSFLFYNSIQFFSFLFTGLLSVFSSGTSWPRGLNSCTYLYFQAAFRWHILYAPFFPLLTSYTFETAFCISCVKTRKGRKLHLTGSSEFVTVVLTSAYYSISAKPVKIHFDFIRAACLKSFVINRALSSKSDL